MDQHNTQLDQDQRKNDLPSVALVCIAKNEDNYIQEWFDYHLKLGFDHVYVYQKGDHMFNQHNKNEVEDFCALNFFKK